jgi:hypothetical protein
MASHGDVGRVVTRERWGDGGRAYSWVVTGGERRYTDGVPHDVERRLRELCLELPDAYEERAWVGTRWRVRNRTFAHVLGVEVDNIGGIELEPSAVATAIDGRFPQGRLAGRSENIKWYLRREGLLDVTECRELDYYLVMAGPAAGATSSRGATRP